MQLHNSYRAHPNREIDETGAWLSIGDLMSGLLMIFALLLVVTMLQLKEGEDQRIVIIQALAENLKRNDLNVKVDKRTGDISILDSVLFDSDSALLKDQGVVFLNSFMPIYTQALLSTDKVSDQISYVVIEGHTSSSGSDAHNMNLSVRRANAVFNKILEQQFLYRDVLMQKLLVAGRGEAESDPSVNLSADRKVVFRIQFSNEQLWARFKTLLSGV